MSHRCIHAPGSMLVPRSFPAEFSSIFPLEPLLEQPGWNWSEVPSRRGPVLPEPTLPLAIVHFTRAECIRRDAKSEFNHTAVQTFPNQKKKGQYYFTVRSRLINNSMYLVTLKRDRERKGGEKKKTISVIKFENCFLFFKGKKFLMVEKYSGNIKDEWNFDEQLRLGDSVCKKCPRAFGSLVRVYLVERVRCLACRAVTGDVTTPSYLFSSRSIRYYHNTRTAAEGKTETGNRVHVEAEGLRQALASASSTSSSSCG